jgi:ssDNA-binding Zn-finger/Zn-ribbon topoisomerase 1
LKEKEATVEKQQELSSTPCPHCGKMMLIKYGRMGKFLACPDPESKVTQPMPEEAAKIKELEDTMAKYQKSIDEKREETGTRTRITSKTFPDLIMTINDVEDFFGIKRIVEDSRLTLKENIRKDETAGVSRKKSEAYSADYQFKFFKKIGMAVGVIIFTSAITASYALGPDIHALSLDEYKAVQYIWDQEKNNTQHCVVGDTYPLLALEAVSHKRIIGGGFPIDQYFGQIEKEAVFQELKNNSRVEVWRNTLNLTKVNICWLVVNDKDFHKTAFSDQHKDDMLLFGDMLVWKYVRKN